MAFMLANVYSKSLTMETQLGVILPQDRPHYPEGKVPQVLILLHGLADNASGWWRRSMLETYANKYGLAVLTPEAQRSFYLDSDVSPDYFTYISKELPKLAEELFGLCMERNNVLMAGLSMGGYGAFRCAFENPDLCSRCGAFSSAANIGYTAEHLHENAEWRSTNSAVGEKYEKEFVSWFGTDTDEIIRKYELKNIAQRAVKHHIVPRLYMSCGTEDPLLECNRSLKDKCISLGIDIKYEEWSGGHDWFFWNASLEHMLDFFLGADIQS